MRPSFKYTTKNANKNYYNYNYELEEKFLSEKNEYILIALKWKIKDVESHEGNKNLKGRIPFFHLLNQ